MKPNHALQRTGLRLSLSFASLGVSLPFLSMSVEQRKVIDFIGTSKADGHVILTIADHLPFDGDDARLVTLQNKLNDYLDFLESGEVCDAYPAANGRPVEISIRFKYAPDKRGLLSFERQRRLSATLDSALPSRCLMTNRPETPNHALQRNRLRVAEVFAVRRFSAHTVMGRKKYDWRVGDTFVVPLADSSFAPGHIVAREPQMLNSVTCAFYEQRVTEPSVETIGAAIAPDALIACLFTSHDLLDSGVWRVVGHQIPAIPASLLPFEHTRRSGWVGAKLHGSGIVTEFLNAFHGLTAWDNWADPYYLDSLLIHPTKKPSNVLLKRSA